MVGQASIAPQRREVVVVVVVSWRWDEVMMLLSLGFGDTPVHQQAPCRN